MMKKYAALFGLLGIAIILAGLIVYSINAKMNTFAIVLLALGLALEIAFVVLRFQEIKSGLTSRSAKFGSNAALMILILLGILVVINILGNRFAYRADMTASQVFSLADQTRKVLKNLDQDVLVLGFFKSGEEAQARELMTEYSHFTQRLKYEFIDPDKQPGLAKKYDVKSYGTVVVEYLEKQEKVNTVSEEAITNAIIKVTREGKKTIYFTTGHGEKDIDDAEQNGFSKFKDALKELNYDVEKIFLVQQPDSLPPDCALLITAGPQTDLLQPEKDMITGYLKRGGKLLLLLDPSAPSSYESLAKEWGIEVGRNFIVELSPVGQLFGAGPIMPVVTSYETHNITEGFQGMMTLFSEARSVSRMESAPSGITVTEIAKTSNNSWGESSPLKENARVGFDEQSDKQGPLSILTVAEQSAQNPQTRPDKFGLGVGEIKARVAIFGDSDFAVNGYFNFQANGNLMLNTVNWLAGEEDLISIRPRDPEDRRLSLTAKQSKMMLWFGVILLPLAVFTLGVYVYKKRK